MEQTRRTEGLCGAPVFFLVADLPLARIMEGLPGQTRSLFLNL
jgi:hypothetical protein